MPFIAYNKVRMHDTDMAGRLYFARQFRFVHDALEDFVESEGIYFDHMFSQNKYTLAIVHAEADYLTLLRVGDKLEIHVSCEKIGTTSFTLLYEIYKEDKTLAGISRTIHVSLHGDDKFQKIPIPPDVLTMLKKHLISPRDSKP